MLLRMRLLVLLRILPCLRLLHSVGHMGGRGGHGLRTTAGWCIARLSVMGGHGLRAAGGSGAEDVGVCSIARRGTIVVPRVAV